MIIVSLQGIRFNVPVGLYPEEMPIHNEIEISIEVGMPTDIEQLPLINYETLYMIAEQVVSEPVQLLETIVQNIAGEIILLYKEASIDISVRKLNPPLGGQVKYAEVRFVKNKLKY